MCAKNQFTPVSSMSLVIPNVIAYRFVNTPNVVAHFGKLDEASVMDAAIERSVYNSNFLRSVHTHQRQ